MNILKYNILKTLYYCLKWGEYSLRVGHNVTINIAKSGKVILPRNGVVRVEKNTEIVVLDGGILEFRGAASLGDETRILVGKGARMVIGNDFSCTGRTDIDAIKEITIGNHVIISVNGQIMDTDHHSIYGTNNEIINHSKPIHIGDNVWIGCTCTILKGSHIPDNIIVGANSLVCGNNMKSNYIYAGNPLCQIREFCYWK